MKACNFLFILSLFFVITGNLFIAMKVGQTQKVSNSMASLFKAAKKGRLTSSSTENTFKTNLSSSIEVINKLKSSVPEIIPESNTLSAPEKEFESK